MRVLRWRTVVVGLFEVPVIEVRGLDREHGWNRASAAIDRSAALIVDGKGLFDSASERS
jgi:hypothetical protein